MPIITTNQESPKNNEKTESIIPGGGAADSPKGGSNLFLLLAILIIILVLLAAAIYYFSSKSQESEKTQELEKSESIAKPIDLALLENNLKLLQKFGALASTTKEEIEVNTITLIEAENTGSTVTMRATEIILDKKKKELAEYKNKMVSLLEELYALYLNQPDTVTQYFEKAIDSVKASGNIVAEEALNTGIDALKTVQPILAPSQHFRNTLDHRL